MADNESNFYVTKMGKVIPDEQLSKKLERIYQEDPSRPSDDITPYEWNEMGMACLFGVIYKHEVRYCPEYKNWYTYSDGVWQKDEGAVLVSEKLKEFARLMIIHCSDIDDETRRSKYLKFVADMGDRRMRDRILKDATGELRISAVDFDKNPYLINCKNGTYNLEDFSFKEHDFADYCTMQTDFKHTVNKKVKSKLWDNFIKEVTEGDKDKIDFLQRALGYSLLGSSKEECMFILYGKTTRNGKSTLLNTILTLLGDYAKVAPVGLICKGDRHRDSEAASPTLAGLKGKRLVTMAESNEYGKLDEEKIKQFTGGEAISARNLHQSPITFRPQFTMWLSCNDLPLVTDKSLFASDRVKVIEFNRHFTDKERDTDLKDKLLSPENAKGIFHWLIEGYKNYLERGLEMAPHLKKVIKQYEKDNDVVLQFLDDKCESNDNVKVKAKDLYQLYKVWAKSEGAPMMSAKRFNSEMERHNSWYSEKTVIGGYPYFKGLGLKSMVL